MQRRQSPGRRYFDILVADAIYLQKPFIEFIEKLGLHWLINLKENQPDLLASAERLTSGPAHQTDADAGRPLDLWRLPEIYWPVADRSIHVMKTVRRQRRSRIVVKDKSVSARQQTQSTEDIATNFYASDLELGAIPPLFLHQLGRSRWKIDAQVFQTITTDSHLKKPSAHQSQALVVLSRLFDNVPLWPHLKCPLF